MRAVTLDIIQCDLPGSARRIITQGDLAPPTERANDFDRRRPGRLLGRDRPTEHFSEAGPLFARSSLGEIRNCRRGPGLGCSCLCAALAFNEVADRVNHNCLRSSRCELTVQPEQPRSGRRFGADMKYGHIRSLIPQSRFHNQIACQHLNRHASQPFPGTCLPDIMPGTAHEFPNARKLIRGSVKKWRCGKFHKRRTCKGNGALPKHGTENAGAFNNDPDLSQK